MQRHSTLLQKHWNPCQNVYSRCVVLTLGTVLYFWIRCSLKKSDVDEFYIQDLPLMLSRPTGILSTCFSPLTLRELKTILGSLRLILSLTDAENMSSNLLNDLKQNNGLKKFVHVTCVHLPWTELYMSPPKLATSTLEQWSALLHPHITAGTLYCNRPARTWSSGANHSMHPCLCCLLAL